MAEKYSGIAAGKPMKASDMEAALDTKANISDMTAALDSKVTLTGNETINGTKTFSTAPVVPNKTTAAANNGTVLATEAQVYLKANASDMTTMLATKENLNNKVTVLSSTSNNTQYPAAKAVYDALAAKANTGDVQVKLPVGTILMYDGTGWQDNVTLVGWYKCNGTNGTPDLSDKFIKGSGSKPNTGTGLMTLSTQHLPAHTHTGSTAGAGGHSHSYTDMEHETNPAYYGTANLPIDDAFKRWRSKSFNTSTVEDHTHGITLNYTGDGQAFDVLPSYYSVIYIKKVV